MISTRYRKNRGSKKQLNHEQIIKVNMAHMVSNVAVS